MSYSGSRTIRTALLSMMALALGLPFGAGPALAHGSLDQQFAGPFEPGDLCCELTGRTTYGVGQSFRPMQTYLVGVDVNVQNLSLSSRRLQLILRSGSVSGTELVFSGDHVKSVAYTGPNSSRWVHFDICPLRLTVNATYTIQIVQENGGGDIRWKTSLSGQGDLYTRGIGYRSNAAVPWDYGFKTYSLPEATSSEVTIDNVAAPANVTRNIPFIVTVNYTLDNDPAGGFVSHFVTASVGSLRTYHRDYCGVQEGVRADQFSVLLPADFPAGDQTLSVHVGVNGFNLAATSIPIHVN